jgi:hypothetical protein
VGILLFQDDRVATAVKHVANDMRKCFIDLLKQDANQAYGLSQAWKELEAQGGRLDHLQGKAIATAAEMVKKFTEKKMSFEHLSPG